MNSALIKVKDLFCERDDRVLFDGLSFDLFSGELVHIKGVNGAGKSTLLRCLAGLYSDFAGEIQHASPSVGIKYFGHKINVKRNLSALENLNLFSLFSANGEVLAERALSEVGLAGYEHVLCSDMSEGQRRRVALASVLMSGSQICFLDEPFSSLDVDGVRFLEQFLISLAARDRLVVITSHHQFEHDNVRVLMLGEGCD
jgi:heme exporter protein A